MRPQLLHFRRRIGASLPAAAALVLTIACAPAVLAEVALTPHNLSVSGPGPVTALSETRICVFCHTPHNAAAQVPLWNRTDTGQAYVPYASTTMEAAPGQPTGASRLCLGCHDGTVALGSVLSEASAIALSGGVTVMPDGAGNLGTNLMNDHPVSFAYTAALAAADGHLADPTLLTAEVQLDEAGELQCTACHDPHDDTNGKFLVLPATDAALCETCHLPDQWAAASHNSAVVGLTGRDADRGIPSPNSCLNCHGAHGGQGAARLLVFSLEEDGCLVCHCAAGPATDIAAEMEKYSRHPVDLTSGVHDPRESLPVGTPHVECVDCHNPHAARAGAAAAPGVPGPLTAVRGVDTDGAAVEEITFGYELCYACHADAPGLPAAATPRQLDQNNTRLEFDPGNPSFHPVEAPGASALVPSLYGEWTTASLVACTDCHTSDDSPAAGGTGPAGPHGSDNPYLLGWNYDTGQGQLESPTAYALCYRCHDRNIILSSTSFRFHRRHVVTAQFSCNACHDPHGIAAGQGDALNHSRLINFDLTWTEPEDSTGELEFVDYGGYGTCTMKCHNHNHLNRNW